MNKPPKQLSSLHQLVVEHYMGYLDLAPGAQPGLW